MDGRTGAGDDRRLAARLGGDGDARRCRASTSTSGPIATPRPRARRRSRRRSRSSTRSTKASGSCTAEGAGLDLRPPRSGRGRRAGAGLQALGFELFADERFASRTVTAAKLPEGHDWKAFNGAIKAHGVVLAGGQGKLTGKIFRLGHLGSVTVEEILGAIAVLETVALEQGRSLTPGSAVGAAYAAAADALGLTSSARSSGAGVPA